MKVTYRLKGKILDKSLKNISLVAVMKNFDHQNHLFKQIVSVASLELTLKKLEQVNPKSNNLDFRNPNTDKPEKKALLVPEVDKETEAPIKGLKSKDKITVTVKGGEIQKLRIWISVIIFIKVISKEQFLQDNVSRIFERNCY
ncbi:TPA: hypothetical protein TXT45_000954 [Streptococcus suis]|nr:hypothetical protein [Streptococcus suis]